MTVDGHSEFCTRAGGVDGVEPAAGFEQLWRVATFEFDCASDFVYWFDDPKPCLNLSENQAAQLLEPILASVRHGTPWEHYDLDQTLDDLGGDPVNLRVQARLLHDSDDRVTGLLGIVTDVSDQRRTEQALRGVMDRYRRLVELNPDPVVVHQQGVVRYVSPAALKMAGIERAEEWVGHSITDFLHPTSADAALKRIASLTEPGMVSEPAEVLLVAPDGTVRPYESISVCVEWDGRPAHQVILRSVAERRRAEAALRYQASLVTHVSDAVIGADPDGRIRAWNPAAEALYRRSKADVIGLSVLEVLGPEAVATDGTPRPGEVEHRRADGSRFSVHVSVSPLRDQLGKPAGAVAVCTDLTERLERLAAEARYSAVVAALDEGVIVVDEHETITSVNASARAMLGPVVEVGASAGDLLECWSLVDETGDSLPRADHPLTVALRTRVPQSRVVIGAVGEAGPRWFSVSAQPLGAEDGQPGDTVVCSFSEITDRKLVEEELNFQATHDPLTRLANRDLILRRLGEAVETRCDDSVSALLLVDLDRFKTVNDTLGHSVGDRVLQEITRRITEVVDGVGEVGRHAGDEFIVVCPVVRDPDLARQLADEVGGAIRAPLQLPSGREMVVTASIGIAYSSTSAETPEVVLSHADIAMYRAKEQGRARTAVFDEDLRAAMSRRLLVHEGLRQAIDANELTVHYQPIVRASDRAVIGVEALARWEHRLLGKITPGEFIPVAEDTGMMIELGTRILHRACDDVARWTRFQRCSPDLALNINISTQQLTDPGLLTAVTDALQRTGLEASRLWFEVTESVLMEDADRSAATLDGLRAIGTHLAIDDFGTGYSSLSYLKRFPVQALKIDVSFVEGLGSDPESEAIVAAIIGLARSLRLQTIGEGVETEVQLGRLRELGCELLQGNLLSRPKPAHLMDLQGRGSVASDPPARALHPAGGPQRVARGAHGAPSTPAPPDGVASTRDALQRVAESN
jgi:diguanylate cyclase (GGDEF)-like protein/PAS domain S-box-containing protein